MSQVIPCDATGILVSFAAEEYNKSQQTKASKSSDIYNRSGPIHYVCY